jgi:hypothetical protein
MSRSVTKNEHASDYVVTVERLDEMAHLQARAEAKKSMLVFGVEGVGKSRLLQAFAKTQAAAVYVSRTNSSRDLMLTLMTGLRDISNTSARLPKSPQTLTTSSLKGVVLRMLDKIPCILVLDHLEGPSRVISRMIKEMNYYDRTPVFFAARTPHMEDIGALQPLCADRSERVELKNFPPAIALEFVRHEAEKTSLWASNLEETLRSIAEYSEGNAGGILHMLKMAHLPQYRIGDQVKTHVLYLDYRMGRWVSAPKVAGTIVGYR